MRWKSGRRSTNIDDRRRRRVGKPAFRGGIGILVIAVIAMFMGVDPTTILNIVQNVQPPPMETQQAPSGPLPNDELADFVSVVLGDTEDTWIKLFQESGKQYQEPQLVMFTGAVQSACGFAQSASGPFYCPSDQKIYIDLAFYRQLKNQFQAPGDFAQAYVIAHEVGHHIQKLIGVLDKTHSMRGQMTRVQSNKLQVRVELQADCLAGIWAHHADRARQILEAGDIEEALNAASRIGDDTLQKQSQGHVVPDAFTHGSSKQRMHWFSVGLKTGDLGQCNTFQAANL